MVKLKKLMFILVGMTYGCLSYAFEVREVKFQRLPGDNFIDIAGLAGAKDNYLFPLGVFFKWNIKAKPAKPTLRHYIWDYATKDWIRLPYLGASVLPLSPISRAGTVQKIAEEYENMWTKIVQVTFDGMMFFKTNAPLGSNKELITSKILAKDIKDLFNKPADFLEVKFIIDGKQVTPELITQSDQMLWILYSKSSFENEFAPTLKARNKGIRDPLLLARINTKEMQSNKHIFKGNQVATSFELKKIAQGRDKVLFGITTDGKVMQLNGDTWKPIAIPDSLIGEDINLTAQDATHYWITSRAGTWECQNGKWIEWTVNNKPIGFQKLIIDGQGTFFLLGTDNHIYLKK